MTGKPYSRKLNVRFDEGELEIGHRLLRQFSTLPVAAPLKGTGKAGLAFLFLNEALAKVKFRCK